VPTPNPTAAPATVEQPARGQQPPRDRRDHRRGRRDERRNRPTEGEHDAPVLAFGDDMPDFLRRPVKLPPLRREPEAA